MNLSLRALAGLAGLLLVAAVGCNKTAEPPVAAAPTGPRMGPGGPPPSANATPEELFTQQCAKCHRSGGQAGGPKGKMGGPDLSKITEDPSKNADWIAEHVKNPKTHSPESRMPSFDGRLTPEQIRKLADYVMSLKA